MAGEFERSLALFGFARASILFQERHSLFHFAFVRFAPFAGGFANASDESFAELVLERRVGGWDSRYCLG